MRAAAVAAAMAAGLAAGARAQDVGAPPAPVTLTPEVPIGPPSSTAAAPQQSGFSLWLSQFRAEAMRQGVRPSTLDAELAGLTYNPRAVYFDRAQPDDSRPGTTPLFSDYLSKRLDAVRAGAGRRLRSDIDATVRGIEGLYGVQPAAILGVWGMETSYGAATGDFDLVRALASLAYDGRRRALFTGELIAALTLIDRGIVSRERLKGSWAGATGQPQFLPSSYLSYAVDGDGDGRADIWNSQADVAASIANYLAKNGWQRGQPWAQRVAVPIALDRTIVRDIVPAKSCARVLAKHSRWLTIAEWRALGLYPVDGKPWPADDTLATLIEPDGPGNGGYLTYANFRAFLEYNCSNFYALSVGLLADAIG